MSALLNWARIRSAGWVVLGGGRLLGPNDEIRRSTSSRSSPERLLSRRASASSGGRTCQGRSLSMSMLILEGRTISVSGPFHGRASFRLARRGRVMGRIEAAWRSEEHTSELQSLMRISYAVFCLKKKKNTYT